MPFNFDDNHHILSSTLRSIGNVIFELILVFLSNLKFSFEFIVLILGFGFSFEWISGIELHLDFFCIFFQWEGLW